MRAGKLRHRVRLQREQTEDDLAGADNVSFIEVDTVWADVRTSGGREFWEAKKLTPELTHEVEIRYRDDVVAGMRFLYGTQVLRIQAPVDPDGRRISLLVMCQELVQ
jgi:phage head-tail adaptor, putative, SPP1 family